MNLPLITTNPSLSASKPKEKSSHKSQAVSVLPSSGPKHDILDIHFGGQVSTRSNKTSGEGGEPPRKPNPQGKAKPSDKPVPPITPRKSKRLEEKAEKERTAELKRLIEEQRQEEESLGEPKTPWVWDPERQKHYTTSPCGSLMSEPDFEFTLTVPPSLSGSMQDRVTREFLRPFAADSALRVQKDQEAKDYIKQMKREREARQD
jgi:hypothetical protein